MSEASERFARELQETLDSVAGGVAEIGKLVQDLKDAAANHDDVAFNAASDKLDQAQADIKGAIDAANTTPPVEPPVVPEEPAPPTEPEVTPTPETPVDETPPSDDQT